MATVSVVVLTMGDRPVQLGAAIRSARRQTGVDVEIVLVVNGGDPDRSLADVVVEPGENLGIPGGRNAGAAVATGGLLCFLDDDGELLGDLFARARRRFDVEADLGVIGLRIEDEHGETTRRHQPGLTRLDRARDVTSFPGGGAVIRRATFDAAGRLCAPFMYGLEETDLAWRIIDRGERVSFDPSLRMSHPRTDPNRHRDHLRLTFRNRVWMAHRLLPLPLAPIYVFDWLGIGLLRNWRSPRAWGALAAGTIHGWRTRPGPRAPIRWRTVWRLTRLGRPPLI
jgi:GT2 family glycosyltransferase